MNPARISILLSVFTFSFFWQPNWVLDNFWYKAEFYRDIPFHISFISFLVVQASLTTAIAEITIRWVKKYA
jgi:hypothetical protein